MNFDSLITIFKYWINLKPARASIRNTKRIDQGFIPDTKGEIRMFMVVRNESLRLPYILKYYFEHGVDRIFVIDNDSTDTSVDILLKHKNVHVFTNKSSYRYSWSWMIDLLDSYGTGYWCVLVDADELLLYPHIDTMTLKDMSSYLEDRGCSALPAIMLNMYSDKKLQNTVYEQGEDPLSYLEYFEKNYKTTKINCLPQKVLYWDLMRKEFFGFSPCISKIPLFKWGGKMTLYVGTHIVTGARVAKEQAAILHIKYFSDFLERAPLEAQRRHHINTSQYKYYKRAISKAKDLSFKSARSIKYKNWQQLKDLKIIKTSKSFDDYARDIGGI